MITLTATKSLKFKTLTFLITRGLLTCIISFPKKFWKTNTFDEVWNMFIIEVKVNVAEIVTADIMASKNNMTNQTEGLMPDFAFTNNLHKF